MCSTLYVYVYVLFERKCIKTTDHNYLNKSKFLLPKFEQGQIQIKFDKFFK